MQLKPFYLSSTANEHVKRWRRLAESTRAVKKFGTTLAEGLHLAQVIAERKVPARSVILRETCAEEARGLAAALAGAAGVGTGEGAPRIYVLADAVYDAVSPVENGTGIMVEVSARVNDRPQQPLDVDALYLDGVQDAGNVGTLIRTAVASGIRHIAASPDTAGFWTPRVLRAGMGAHFAAHLYENVYPEDLHAMFKARRLAADARGGRDLFRTPGWENTATVWMMGAEGPGLSERALAVADARFLIDIEHDCESLNVGAAAAVCLFEQRRRRLLAP